MSPTQTPPLENEDLKKALESLLFITDHPLSLSDLGKITGVKDQERLRALIGELQAKLDQEGSAVQLLEVADGFQMGTRPSYAPFVRKLFAERMTMRLSTAAHETLSIVAYKQPITRAEIEEIRGVEVIAALETLLEKRLLKVVGRKESVGRPLMYGTTPEFLRHFGLKSIEALPPLETFVAQLAEEPKAPQAPADGCAHVPAEGEAPAPEAAVETEAPAPEAAAEVAEPRKNIWTAETTAPEEQAEETPE